ncbi:MAG: sigma-70 family RNA polymerase sigma factor [Myxococcota bacterium]
MADDAELLDAWRDGDAGAGEELVRRHFVSVYRFFRNKVSGDLDDLVQATFARCVERVEKVADTGFRAYMFGVARNVLREHYRKVARNREVDLETASVADHGMTPSRMLAEREDHRLLLAALREIPIDEQVILELIYWESMTGKELAAVLDVPEGTARTRLRSARQSLEAALARLARSPEVLQSTLDNLDKWSAAIRKSLAAGVL